MLNENLYLKKELRFKDGKFKIALFSDIHGGKVYDKRLKRDFDAMIQNLDPDLVLFSGDVFDLDAELRTEEEIRTFLDEFTEVLEKNNIPWANVYGNHEREGALPNADLQPIFESYPNCISKAGPTKLRGTGNHMLPIKNTAGDKIIFNVWGFDSGCTIDICDWEHPNFVEKELKLPNPLYNGAGYDNPKFDQVAWYYSSSEELEEYCGEKVPSIMYFHIPIPEHTVIVKNPVETGMVGECGEKIACSELNNGLFAAALLRGDVKGIFCGHDHINDFCGTYCGIQLGYNSALCYDCYNNDDMRGCRVFEIEESDPANYKTYCARAKDIVPGYNEKI